MKVSEGRQKKLQQIFVPSQINFSIDASTSIAPPVAGTSIDDSIGQMSDSVMMARSITQPEVKDPNNDLITQNMTSTFDSALLTKQVPT